MKINTLLLASALLAVGVWAASQFRAINFLAQRYGFGAYWLREGIEMHWCPADSVAGAETYANLNPPYGPGPDHRRLLPRVLVGRSLRGKGWCEFFVPYWLGVVVPLLALSWRWRRHRLSKQRGFPVHPT